jgi:hypothetical protein
MPLTKALTALAPGRACPFRPVCQGSIAARTMIVVIPQLICCGISTKSEITLDHASRARALRPSPRTALTVTTKSTALLLGHVSEQGKRIPFELESRDDECTGADLIHDGPQRCGPSGSRRGDAEPKTPAGQDAAMVRWSG